MILEVSWAAAESLSLAKKELPSLSGLRNMLRTRPHFFFPLFSSSLFCTMFIASAAVIIDTLIMLPLFAIVFFGFLLGTLLKAPD